MSSQQPSFPKRATPAALPLAARALPPARRRRLTPHPLVAAICAALAGPVLALPQGGQVVAGQATISTPTPTSQVITQTSQRAVIDWTSFSIAAGERVRFNQPSTTAVTLNRVIGYDPSQILGQMSSNGRVFLVNPYGVVFGAGARIDVGGLVVSTLSMSTGDFMAGRYALTSDDGVAASARGVVRNDGEIRIAPGGTAAFVGPQIVNTGSIEAHGGRVALAATGGARVDLDGDGLVIFETRDSSATARLEQLGRISADGGSIELRAQARAALADTVLNVEGVTRARSIGTREGRIVIDGGADGTVTVGGVVDVTGLGAGERGGQARVEGRDITLTGSARLDASGDTGGGRLFVGGGAHGADATLRNATTTTIATGATLAADATGHGSGGTVVAWADDTTRFTGRISARGGEAGGDGGWVEVSGRNGLLYAGSTDTRAPLGATGSLLLDPTNVTVSAGADSTTNFNTTTLASQLATSNVTISTASINAQAGTIAVQDPLAWNGTNSLTLRADSGIGIASGAPITAINGGSLILLAGGSITLDAAIALNGGNFRVANTGDTGPAPSTFVAGAAGTISTAGLAGTAGGSVEIRADGNITTSTITTTAGTASGAGLTGGAVTIASTNGTVTTGGVITARGGAAGGSNQNGGTGGAVNITSALGLASIGANILTAGGAPTGAGTAGAGGAIGITGSGITVASAATVNAGRGTIALDGNGGAIALGTSTLTTTSNGAGAITVRDASTVALGTLTTGATGSVQLGNSADITGAVTQAGTIGSGTLTVSTAGAVTLGGANTLTSLGAVETGGNFTLNNAVALSVAGTVAATGAAQISTTAGALTVANTVTGNGVTLTAGGAGNALALQAAVSGGAGGVTLDAGGAITQTAAGTVSTTGTLALGAGGSITLDQANSIGALGNVSRGGAFTLNDADGGLNVTGNVTGGSTGNAVSIGTAGGALALSGNITTTGTGTLALTGVGVTQSSGTVLAGGDATINAGTGAISLLSTTNDFGANVALAATGAAAVRDANALTITSATGNGLTAIAGTSLTVPTGGITTIGGAVDLQALGGTLTTPGAISTGGGAITLTGAQGLAVNDNLTSGGGNIRITGGGAGGLAVANTVTVAAAGGSIVASGGGGAVDLGQSTLSSSNTGTAVTVRDATTVALGNISATAGTVAIGVGQDVTGAVTQNAGTTLAAATLTASTAAALTLGTVGTLTLDNLGDVTRGGALTLVDSGGGLALTGDVSGGSTAHNVAISTSGGALALGNATVVVTGAGNTLALTGAGVTQGASGSVRAAGASSIGAGTGNIALTAAANDFGGAVDLSSSGTSVSIRDTNALTLGTLTLAGGVDLTASAGTTLSVPGAITTTGDLSLSAGGVLSVGSDLSARDVSLTGNGGIGLGANVNASRDLTLTTTNTAVTQTTGVLTVADHTTLATGTGSVTLTQANALTRLGGNAGSVSVTNTGGLVLDTISASALALTTGGAITQAGAATVTGAVTVNAAGQAVSLDHTGNAIGSVGGTAATLTVVDAGGIALDGLNVTALNVDTSGGNGAITQNAAVTVGTADLNAGSGAITLANATNDFGTVGVRGGTVQLRDNGAIVLAASNAANFAVTAGGAITQSGALAVPGTASLTSTAAVTLTNGGNDLGTFAASAAGQAVSVADANALVLGTISAGTLNVTTGNGAVTQSGAAVVTGATVVSTGSGAITLDNAGNDFVNAAGNRFTGGAITVRDANALTVTTLAAGANQNVSVTAGGALTLPAAGIATGTGSLTLSSGALLTTPGALSGGNISLTGATGIQIGDDVTATGTLSLSSTNSAIAQTAGRIVAGGAATVTAGTGAVTLAGASNDFATVNVASASSATLVDQNALGVAGNVSGTYTATAAGVLSTSGALTGGSLVLTGTSGISLGHDVTASTGTLTLASTDSAITQTAGAIRVASGLTTVTAGTGDVTLTQAGNDFSDTVGLGISVTGGAVRITDTDDLRIVSLSNATNHDLSLIAGGSITGIGGNIDTGSANLTISSGAGFTSFGTLRGTNVAIGGGSGGITLTQDVTALGTLTLTASNAAITQTAGTLSAAGTTTANAGTGAVTLTQASNDFAGFGGNAGAINVRDANAIVLAGVNATSLTVQATSVAQTAAAINVTGATSVNTGAGSIALNGPANQFGSFGASGGAVSVADAGALALDAVTASSLAVTAGGAVTQNAAAVVSGSTSVNAGGSAVALTHAANNFGTVGATGGAVAIVDSNGFDLGATNAASLSLTAAGAITQSGAAVVSGTTTIAAGGNAVTLTNAGNNLATVVATAGALALRDATALNLGAITATSLSVDTAAGNGAITQSGAAVVSGLTSVSAGSGAVTLGNAGNDFATLAASGGAVNLRDANALTLGAVNATTLGVTTGGALAQSAAAAVSGATTLTTAGSATLTQAGNDFGSVAVTAGGAVALVDQNALGVSGSATGSFSASAGGVLATTGAVSGAPVALTGAGGLSLGHDVTSTGALTLASTNSAITQTAGRIGAAGLTTVSAGSGDITLTQASNDFANVSLSGGAVRITDANALVVDNLVNGANRDVALIAGSTLSGTAGNIDTGSANLTLAAGSGFSTFGTLRGTNLSISGGSGGVALGHDVTALGNLALNAANAAITQTAGHVTVTGATTASAGTGPVTLTSAGNDFGSFGASGGAVSVRDANAIALGPITATALTVDTAAGNGAVTQTGAAVVSGATTITAGSGSVALVNAGNDFSSVAISAGAVSVRDLNALVLAGVTGSSLAVDTSAGNGNVTQSAPLAVTGAVGVNAGTGNVTLANAANQLGSFGATGTTVVVTDSGALALAAVNATTLTVNAGGAVTQNAAAAVGGTTTVAAGTNAVTLTNAGNDFGTLVATGGAVSVRDANAIDLGSIGATSLTVDTAAGNGAVTQSGAAVVSGATTVTAGSGAVTLTNAGNDFSSIAASGGAVALRDANALVLAGVNAGTLGITTNGALTQTGAVVVGGNATVATGTGNVSLTDAGNDFAALGVSGGAIRVVDANALTLTGLASGANQAVAISAGGRLTLPATAIDTGTATLTLGSGDALATAANLRGTGVSLTAAGPLTLGHDVTSLGTLALTSANAAITQTGGAITAAGAATVNAGSGNVTLGQTGNDFQAGVALTGGALSVRDTNDLAVTSITHGPNQSVSLIAGGSLSLPATAIDTGTAALTLQALGGSLVVNGPLSGGLVTLTGATGLTLAANVTSVGDQIYTTAVQLAGDVTLASGSSRIDLQGGVIGAGHDLTLASSSAAADAIRTGAAISGVDALTVNGTSTLGGSVTTSGAQTWAGRVTLAADVALNAGASRIDLQGGVDGAGHDLALASTLAAADAVRIGGAIGGLDQLTVTGPATLAASAGTVATTGAQTWNGTVTLGGDSSFVAPSLTIANGISAGSANLAIGTDALSLAGTISGTGNASIAGLGAGTTLGIAGGAGTLQVTQATLDRFASFGTLTLGRSDGTGNLTFGNLLLPTHLAVQSGSGNVTFTGTVASAGAARDLGVTTGGVTTFDGSVGGALGSPQTLATLTVNGESAVNASVNTRGAQTYTGNVAIGEDATLSAGTIAIGGSLDVGSHAATLYTDALTLGGTAGGNGAGSLRVAARDATGTIGLAGGAGTLQVSQSLLDRLGGVPQLTIGRTDGSGAITAGALTLGRDLAIASGSGNVTLASVDSAGGPARDLAVSTTGTTTLGGAIGATQALDTLAITGTSRIGANVSTSGAQSYGGAATLIADATLTGSTVDFAASVDGPQSLTVNATATRFAAGVGQATALTRLVTDAAGTTTLGGNVTTTGAQTWGDALALATDVTLRGGTLTLAGPVDGAHALAVDGTQVTLAGAIGSSTALTSVAATGPLTLAAGSVTTTGAQAYAGSTVLGADAALQGASVAFGSTLDGGHALTVQTAGTTAFAGTVGGSTPLASLATNGGGLVQVGGTGVSTTGAQRYSGPLQFAGAATLSGASLALQGAATGATDLTLRTDQLTGATALAGTGTLTIAPLSQGTSIGVAGGAGALQVAQSVLDGASGFGAHVIGRDDGTGTLTTGNLVLRADTTLQTGPGLLDVAGRVDGGHALALNSGGTTRIGGPIGTTTPLASLTVDNNAAAADSTGGTTGERTLIDSVDASGRARIVTIGAQNWLDPVIATVPVSFSGGAIVAHQSGNRFEQGVTATATSLDLYSATDLQLGDVRLAGGGRFETGGVLHISGALRLDGGTLLLIANGTPTVGDFTDPDLVGRTLAYGFTPLGENSATIVQGAGGSVATAAGTLLVVRATAGGSIALDGTGNTLLGSVSAVSGTPGTTDMSRLQGGSAVGLSFVRIASSEIHVAGASPSSPDASVLQAGIEGDAIKLTANVLTTGADGLIRARLPFNNVQGSQTSVPGITFVMTPDALAQGGGFGGPDQSQYIRVRVGGVEGGFLTARPNGASGDTAVIFLGGPVEFRPFYDGAGQLTEIRIFYNGDAPRTPQEEGALAAVIALIEDARHARFEEAVRTENVSSRLRSGVIAEVGAGRPATVGRESIKLPEVCDLKSQSLRCE